MALDEVLLARATDDAVLRLYVWSEPTVSFGYFEPSLSAKRAAQGRATVRRWTGGGIVEHGDDLTYSLCVPRSCVFAGLRSAESYRRIHAAVAHALKKSGLPVESHASRLSSPNSPHGNACFDRPVLHDLLADGRKVAGGAQRRSRGGLLHQGSVRLLSDAADAYAGWRERMWRELPAALAGFCDERSLTAEEISQAEALALSKYATAAWTDRF